MILVLGPYGSRNASEARKHIKIQEWSKQAFLRGDDAHDDDDNDNDDDDSDHDMLLMMAKQW